MTTLDGATIIADGFVGGNLEAVSDVLYDAKAYSADSGPDVKSMLGYKAAMAVQCLKKGDIEHPKAFNKVRFVVAHHDVADVWAQVIPIHMDDKTWEIAVGPNVVYPVSENNDNTEDDQN
jgi:hypothetical protein